MKITYSGIESEFRFSAPDNEGWMQTVVFVKVLAFEGSLRCTVQIEEWKEFVRGLRALESAIGCDAQLTWTNMEGNIELKMSLEQRGALHGSYRFSPDNFSLGPVLSGSFEADQSFLSEWTRSASEPIKHAR